MVTLVAEPGRRRHVLLSHAALMDVRALAADYNLTIKALPVRTAAASARERAVRTRALKRMQYEWPRQVDIVDLPGPYPPPWGDPPRAGVIDADGHVITWRHGTRAVLGRWPGGELLRAVETAYGVVLAGAGAVLARFDGGVEQLSEGWCKVTVSDDGRLLAISEEHRGRQGWPALHLIDLATGTRDTLPVDAVPVAVHDGTVYFGNAHATMQWIPGTDPRPTPYRIFHIDPLTGTRLANDGAAHPVVIRPDGSRRPLPPGLPVLMPGAERACTFSAVPTGVQVHGLTDSTVGVRTIPLPQDTAILAHDARRPAVDSRHHLVAVLGGVEGLTLQAPLLRIDVATGALERIRLDDCAGVRGLVKPLPRHNG